MLRVFAAFLLAVGLVAPSQAAEPQAVIWPQLADVRLDGRLSLRYRANVAYLLDRLRTHRDWMLDPYRKHVFQEGWAGEYAGKWLDAASLMAAGTGNSDLAGKANAFAADLRSCQQPDGCLAIHSEGQFDGSGWDVWNTWCTLTGLTTHYEQQGDQRSLAAAAALANWLVARYTPPRGDLASFFKTNAHDGGINVDCAEQIVNVYRHTHDAPCLAFAKAVLGNYSYIQAMRRKPIAPLIHPYVLLAYCGAVVDLDMVEHGTADLPWLERVWDDLVARHVYPTGSLGDSESLATPPSDRNKKPQETCATVEWILFNMRLYCATRNVRYVHAIENAVYNALLAAQSEDGMKWTYFTPFRYRKDWFGGPTSCCYWSGPRGIARLPALVYAVDDEGIRVNLFEKSVAKLQYQGRTIGVEQMTAYPAAGNTVVKLTPGRPRAFAVRLRLPPWTTTASVTVNDARVDVAPKPGEYVVLHRTWSDGDRIALAFDMPTYLRRLGQDGVVVVRGPEVMAVDARDNGGLDLDAVRIRPDTELTPTANSVGTRRRYTCTAIVSGSGRQVVFTPYADAGNDNARFRTCFPEAVR
jgi:uncharacterized protein